MGRYLHSAIFLLTASLATATTPACAHDANQRIDRLEQEVEDINEKLDRILQAIGGDRSNYDGAQVVRPAAVRANRPGLTLNLAVIERSSLSSGAPPQDPGSNFVASEVIENPSDFNYTQFLAQPSMQTYAGLRDQSLGQFWTGVLMIPESGMVDFVADISSRAGGGRFDCIAQVRIDGQMVVSTEVANLSFNKMATNRGTAQLSEGPHQFAFWTFCADDHDNYTNYKALGFALKMKLPSEMAPKPVPSEYFSPK